MASERLGKNTELDKERRSRNPSPSPSTIAAKRPAEDVESDSFRTAKVPRISDAEEEDSDLEYGTPAASHAALLSPAVSTPGSSSAAPLLPPLEGALTVSQLLPHSWLDDQDYVPTGSQANQLLASHETTVPLSHPSSSGQGERSQSTTPTPRGLPSNSGQTGANEGQRPTSGGHSPIVPSVEGNSNARTDSPLQEMESSMDDGESRTLPHQDQSTFDNTRATSQQGFLDKGKQRDPGERPLEIPGASDDISGPDQAKSLFAEMNSNPEPPYEKFLRAGYSKSSPQAQHTSYSAHGHSAFAAITEVTKLRSNVVKMAETLETVNSQVNKINAKLHQQDNNVRGAAIPSRQRGHQKPRNKYLVADPYQHHEQRNRVKKMVRKHLLHILRIPTLAYIRVCVPLTEQERLVFASRQDGAIVITPEHFRLDLEQPRDSEFNMMAISVFAKDLHHKVTVDHWYSLTWDGPRPFDTALVALDYLEYVFYHHLKHVKDVYKQSKSLSPTSRQARRKSAARKQRKQTLHKSCLAVVLRNAHLRQHADLLLLAGTQADSSDESDPESTLQQIPGLACARTYTRVSPAWRSLEMAQFLWTLDVLYLLQRQPKAGCRRIPGAAPRIRNHSSRVNDDVVGPVGLHRNCYNQGWLSTLWPFDLEALKIKQEDYPLIISTARPPFVPPTHKSSGPAPSAGPSTCRRSAPPGATTSTPDEQSRPAGSGGDVGGSSDVQMGESL